MNIIIENRFQSAEIEYNETFYTVIEWTKTLETYSKIWNKYIQLLNCQVIIINKKNNIWTSSLLQKIFVK